MTSHPLHAILDPHKSAALQRSPPTPVNLDLKPLLSRNRQGLPVVAFTLQDILSPKECAALITRSESIGYDVALVNVSQTGAGVHIPGYRDGQRVLIDDIPFAAELFSRIRPFIPATYQSRPIIGMNERLRFLKYNPGDQFQQHMDGEYRRADGSGHVTKITVQFYLNEACKGGATTFLEERMLWRQDGDEDGKKLAVEPKTGQVLVFQHDLVHEGSRVTEGVKYVIRSDILYGPPIHNFK
ncbi:hypothetical protein BC939DRAFT_445906 [Gamsiella multidivaricata]|uniref:uncharacterized protein n=1 Tax=Gamsiella multidivaricata TaxID=101098 RepID=UPI00221F41F1|nr:uncharacterized protein BC939DRAFT_445906 [Gamsiella multidivaricata]KAG0369809.1 hypothetical protein BGZ54_008804 [Gamsiella multidivaricata]KAI7827144.1 hypothetical protein BC939DRAFT_445906 [Gamsiella multidivaricata]